MKNSHDAIHQGRHGRNGSAQCLPEQGSLRLHRLLLPIAGSSMGTYVNEALVILEMSLSRNLDHYARREEIKFFVN